ncbi:hypothetical protein LZ198_16445 [Myxococcus sp. K15C18031901]|uniref:hypothetical protein n=1 Tax=Myxococcus dinghuensis TaxID=2906761 RepID=UPI0020A780CA|nr:hypothetical protein [Myxococcus dinghuensis]MCP3100460.1 hypothetical protein [Myxococcus dinghuensis]
MDSAGDAGRGIDTTTDAAEPEDVRERSLDQVVETPPSLFPSSAMVRERSEPPNGERERRGELVVTARCGGSFCVDGLKDLGTGRDIIPLSLNADERRILAAPGALQRAVKLVSVDERHVSVYLGETEFSGGAHANNTLECATYSRRDGRRVKLSEVVPRAKAKALLQEAVSKMESFQEVHLLPGYRFRPDGFLLDERAGEVRLCAARAVSSEGTVLEVTLPL